VDDKFALEDAEAADADSTSASMRDIMAPCCTFMAPAVVNNTTGHMNVNAAWTFISNERRPRA